MNSKMMMIGFLSTLASLASSGSIARADSSATACRSEAASLAADIEYKTFGVQNASTIASRWVICPIERATPLGTFGAGYWVDGHNSTSTSTACDVYSYAFDGTLVASRHLDGAGTWDLFASFPFGLTPAFGYASMRCLVPGNRSSQLYGATAAP